MTVPTIQRMSRVSVPAIGESTLGPIRLQGRQLRDGLGRTEYWVHDLAHGDCRGSARVSVDRHRDDHLHGGRRALRGSSDFGSTHCARAGHVHGSRSCSLSSIVPPTFESSPWRHTAWTTCRHGRARLSGGTAEAAGRRCPGSAPLDISMCFTSPEQPVQSGSTGGRPRGARRGSDPRYGWRQPTRYREQNGVVHWQSGRCGVGPARLDGDLDQRSACSGTGWAGDSPRRDREGVRHRAAVPSRKRRALVAGGFRGKGRGRRCALRPMRNSA